MKHMRIILAMALALMLALPMFALGEEPADEAVQVEEVGEIALPEDPGSPSEETPEEEAPQTDPDAVVTYCFIVADTLYASQAAREGEAIVCPEAPEAPEGMAFAGWALDDEFATPLFVDADEDGEIDAVVAHIEPNVTIVNVIAQFVEADEAAPAENEDSDEAAPAEDEDAEEAAPAEDEVADEAAPAEDEDADEVASPDAASDVPVANELTYTGEAQALVSAAGEWLYSLDGENYACEIPTAVNAGEYTVYFKAAEDAEAQTLTVVVAKADVVFTPPEAATSEE